MKLINIEQNTPEWYEYRKNKIGASMAPIIMGVSPHKTPLQLYEELLGYTEKPFEHQGMRDGHSKEIKARALYEIKSSCPMFTQVIEHDDHSWMMASLDGISIDYKKSIEIKCLSFDDHLLAQRGEYPKYYYAQMQHQMAITGHEYMEYVSYYDDSENPDNMFVIIERRNDEYIADLIKKEKKFLDCLLSFTPPELMDRDYIDMNTDRHWLDFSTEWGILQAQKKSMEKQEKELKEKIIQHSNGRNCRGFGLSSLKIVRKGNIDYTAIPELKEIDLELYRKAPSEYWKIA